MVKSNAHVIETYGEAQAKASAWSKWVGALVRDQLIGSATGMYWPRSVVVFADVFIRILYYFLLVRK